MSHSEDPEAFWRQYRWDRAMDQFRDGHVQSRPRYPSAEELLNDFRLPTKPGQNVQSPGALQFPALSRGEEGVVLIEAEDADIDATFLDVMEKGAYLSEKLNRPIHLRCNRARFGVSRAHDTDPASAPSAIEGGSSYRSSLALPVGPLRISSGPPLICCDPPPRVSHKASMPQEYSGTPILFRRVVSVLLDIVLGGLAFFSAIAILSSVGYLIWAVAWGDATLFGALARLWYGVSSWL